MEIKLSELLTKVGISLLIHLHHVVREVTTHDIELLDIFMLSNKIFSNIIHYISSRRSLIIIDGHG
jgi:hypothetical protein